MRNLFKHVAWALATAAMILATPMQAAAFTAMSPNSSGVVTTTTTAPGAIANAFTTTTSAESEAGGGWAELYCMTCVGIGSFVLYSGGISMLPLLLGHTGTVSTLTGSCLLACESAIKSLLK